jgi:hypothetical protein
MVKDRHQLVGDDGNANTLRGTIGEAFNNKPKLHWSTVLHEIADGTELGDVADYSDGEALL